MTTQYQRDREHRVDFLRGLALISMFINHIPGNIFAKITHTNFGFSDAAEVFVTLAGFAAAQAYYPAYASGEDLAATLKAWRRAGLLYFCHIASTIAAIAILAMAAIVFTQPGYLGDLVPPLEFTLTPLFTDPARSYIGIATLGHQLGYFNILPMYMVLLFMLPLIMALTRASLSLLLIASVALWVFAGIFALNMPNYPNLGDWSFNPFAWQLLFVMGFALGVLGGVGVTSKYRPGSYGLLWAICCSPLWRRASSFGTWHLRCRCLIGYGLGTKLMFLSRGFYISLR